MLCTVDGTIYMGLCILFNVTKVISNRTTIFYTNIGKHGEMEVGVLWSIALPSITVEIQ